MGDGEHLHPRRQPRQPLADGVGRRAARARIDLVEHQSRRRAAIGQHDLQRQHETRQLAARSDLHQRPRPRSGIGLHPELHPLGALRAACASSVTICAVKIARSSFNGASSAFTAGSSALTALSRALVSAAAQGAIMRLGGLARLAQSDEPRLAGVERGEIGGEFFRQRGKIVDGAHICARRRAGRTAAPRPAPARAGRIRRRARPDRASAAPDRARSARRRAP